MVHDHLVDEATIEGLKKHYSHDLMIELLMLIGWYQGLAGVLNSSGIPLDSSLEDILTRLRN
jgi:alkylhydroperoxidase family enzyme